MFIRNAAALAATAAILLAVGASTASATLIEDPGGGAVPVGSRIINGASDSATLTVTGLGTIHCAVTSTTFTVGTNTTTTVTGTLNQLTFTSCTDSIPVINIASCHLRTGTLPTVDLTPVNANEGTITLSSVTARCFIALNPPNNHASGCDYSAATASGSTTNTPSRIVFPAVNVTHVTGTTGDLGALCGTGATFSTTLTDIRTESAANTVTLVP